MSQRMFVPFHDDGIISQFEGYEQLEELDWDAYRARYGNIQRLDRILRAEGDDPDRYKVSKQADVVMLFYLFSPSVLRGLFERLGYEYRLDTAARNIAYYDRRTSHGSTLSFVTYAGALAALDLESSWGRFLVALRSDAEDIQGGTTREGIHMGVMSGTLDLMQRAYPGSEIRDGVLHFEPRLPAALEEVSFWMQFQRTPVHVTLDHDELELSVHREGAGGPIKVAVGDEVRELCPGDHQTFELFAGAATGQRETRV
jgi:trehalose/maltose hydrolase-like predicted phosphorylase